MPSFLFGCAGNLHKNTPSTQISSSAMKEPSWHKFLRSRNILGPKYLYNTFDWLISNILNKYVCTG